MGKTPFMTGVAICNSMVGSSMILFPVTFNQTGILVNVLFVFLMAALMALTCRLLVSHLREDQLDISVSIKRKLGPTFGFTFGLLSSITVFLVSSVFFLLAVDLFYDVFLETIWYNCGYSGQLSISEKVFKLILMGVFALLNYLPDLKYVFKASNLAMGALVLSSTILIISIAFNTDNINSSFLAIKPLSIKDLMSVASVNGFAFICHPSKTKTKKENDKAVYSGYIVTIVLYLAVGVLGALSIFGRVPPMDKSSYNIIDFYSGQIQAPIIGFLTFSYLFMVSPIFPYVSKTQAIELIPQAKRQKISGIMLKASIIFSILWLPCNVLFIIFDTSPTVVIGFISTVMAYYATYFLPIFMSFKVGDYVGKTSVDTKQESLIVPEDIKEEEQTQSNNINKAESLLTDADISNIAPIPTGWQRIFYFCVLGYGSVMLIMELILFFA